MSLHKEALMSADSAHGNVKVYWVHNMLVIEPTSAFNIEGLVASINTLKQAIDTRIVDKWARIVFFQNTSTLGPLDGMELVIDSFQYCALNGCQLVSVVGGSVLNKESYTKIGEHVDLPVYFFDSMQEAKDFINQNLESKLSSPP